MRPLRSRNAAFAAYGVLLVLPTLVFGGMYWHQIVEDYERELEAAPERARATAGRLAESLNERFSALIAEEEKRPFYNYAEVMSPKAAMGEALPLQTSPLKLDATPTGILCWFSYDRGLWPLERDATAYFGAELLGDEHAERRAALTRAASEFAKREETTSYAPHPPLTMGTLVPARVVAVYANQSDEELECLRQNAEVLRGWSVRVDSTELTLKLDRASDGTPRAVASRRILVERAEPLASDARAARGAPCLRPLHDGIDIVQGFLIDVDWLLNDLIDELGAETLRPSERLIRAGVSPGPDERCEVCADVRPIETLGFDAVKEEDRQLGAVQVAVNTELLLDRFSRQRKIFGGLAVMTVLALMTGIVLIERTVRRDLDEAEQRQNFVSAVTHELRTPLAAIRLYGEMLLEGWTDDPDKIHEYHQRILRETRRLSTLVEGVLRQGRILSGPAAAQATDLNRLVEAQLDALAVAHPSGDAESWTNDDLEFDLAPDIPPVVATAEAVAGILTNLVENARKYAPWNPEDPSTRILIRTARERGRVVLEVLDRGPGIPAAERDRIFEAFHRLGNEATRTTTGTGLGLHLVRLHAESVGADASVRPRPRGGSIFRVRFRIAGET